MEHFEFFTLAVITSKGDFNWNTRRQNVFLSSFISISVRAFNAFLLKMVPVRVAFLLFDERDLVAL